MKNKTKGNFWKTLFLVSFYLSVNLSLTFHTKWIFCHLKIESPWFVSGIHLFFTGIFSFLFSNFFSDVNPDKTNDDSSEKRILYTVSLIFFSILYTMNIVLNNLSMLHSSLALQQLSKSAGPVLTLILESVFFKKRISFVMIIPLLFITLGIIITSVCEIRFVDSDSKHTSCLGIFLSFLSVLLASLKNIATNKLLRDSKHLTPIKLIKYISAPCSLECLSISLLVERNQLEMLAKKITDTIILLSLITNGSLAFLVNYASFTTSSLISPLSMTIIGNLKQSIVICFAFVFFSKSMNFYKIFGTLLALIGSILYGICICYEKSEKTDA